MNTNRRHAVAALITAGLLWGTTVPLSKLALEWLSPGWLTVVRFALAAGVLLVAARGRGLRRAFTPAVLGAGALGYGGSVLLQNAGISRTSVTHAALLIGAVPVLVAIIAAVWHHTVARPVAWFGFALSLGGVGLITVGSRGGGATLAGDGLVLASLVLSAALIVAQGRLLNGRDPVAVTAVQFLGAALGTLPVAVVTGGVPAVPGSTGPLLAVVALAGGGTLLPFTLFAFGQSRVSAEVAGAFVNIEPLVGAIVGAVAFRDPVGLAQVVGGVAVVAGIGLSSLPLSSLPLSPRRRAGHRELPDARQPRVQGRSFSGLRTTQMCLIRPPATSNANTVTVTPSCSATSPGWPLTARSRNVMVPGFRLAISTQARAICSEPSIGRRNVVARPPPSATAVASGSSRPMRASMSFASQACLKALTTPACRAAGPAGACEARTRRRAEEASWRHVPGVRPVTSATSAKG
jgi:O-acetylserine/cysteine efflux transporter